MFICNFSILKFFLKFFYEYFFKNVFKSPIIFFNPGSVPLNNLFPTGKITRSNKVNPSAPSTPNLNLFFKRRHASSLPVSPSSSVSCVGPPTRSPRPTPPCVRSVWISTLWCWVVMTRLGAMPAAAAQTAVHLLGPTPRTV